MVGEAALDYPALLLQRKVVLANKPRGSARIAFSAADFGNFLAHPLVAKAAAGAVQVRSAGDRRVRQLEACTGGGGGGAPGV
jgi:hypothetical protein